MQPSPYPSFWWYSWAYGSMGETYGDGPIWLSMADARTRAFQLLAGDLTPGHSPWVSVQLYLWSPARQAWDIAETMRGAPYPIPMGTP